MEKACAKVYGCYEALEGGTIEEASACPPHRLCYPPLTSSLLTTHYSPHHQLQALALLTGFPTERLALQGPEQPAAARYAAALTLTRARTRTLTATLTQPEP